MSRCKACDYCDTVGEMSPYKWGVTVNEYTGRFMVDTQTGDEYCLACYVNIYELYDDQEITNGGEELPSLGGIEVEFMDSRDARRDEETDNESGS